MYNIATSNKVMSTHGKLKYIQLYKKRETLSVSYSDQNVIINYLFVIVRECKYYVA